MFGFLELGLMGPRVKGKKKSSLIPEGHFRKSPPNLKLLLFGGGKGQEVREADSIFGSVSKILPSWTPL